MNLTINKVAAGVVGLAMVAGLAFAFTASQAHAISLSELVELFIALEVIPADKADEARAVLSGQDEDTTSSSMACNFTRNLTTGDTGADVMELQQFLNANGYTVAVSGVGSAGNETQYFGPATAGAVASFQEAYAADILTPLGLTAGTGYFGASTRAMANSLCSTVDDTPDVPDVPTGDDDDDDDDDDMGGDEGSIDSYDATSPDESTLEEGTEGGVVAVDLEIEGDVEINRVDAYVADPTTGSNDADDYFVRAFLLVDGDEVAEIDVDDFDEDDYDVISDDSTDEFRLRFSGLDLVFEDGDEPEFQVGFEVVGNLDSTDEDAEWTVEIESMRYEDGQGWTDTETFSGVTEDFGFEAEEMAEISITEASSNPDSSVIKVDDDTDETDDVTVFVFNIEEENGVDVTIEDLTLTIAIGSTTLAESTVVESVALIVDGDEIDSESVPTDGVVEFEDLGLDIDGNDDVDVEVALTFEGNDGGDAYAEGETVTVSFTSLDKFDDANGNDEGDITPTGTPAGETHELRSEGVFAEIVSTDTDRNDDYTVGDFEIKFDLTAFEDDFYVGSTSAAVTYHVELDGVEVSTTTTAAISSTADETSTYGNYEINDGQTETFTLTVSLDPDTTGYYRVVLESVDYSATDGGSIDDLTHTVAPAADFKTSQVSLDAS